MPENSDNSPSGKGADEIDKASEKDIEASITPDGKEAEKNEAREKENNAMATCDGSKPHQCGKGQCCGRQSTRHTIISRYSNEN